MDKNTKKTIFRMAYGFGSRGKYSSCISKEEYQELMKYARERNIKLEGFKKYAGDIHLIKEMLDDIVIVAKDFPKILEGRKSLVVRLDENLLESDFATTNRHLISINARIFNNREYLEKEYQLLADIGMFVEGTNYRSIIRHELGHVVAYTYRIDTIRIAKQILNQDNIDKIYEYIMNNLSLYAAEYEHGVEFISESFSAYYSNIDNFFAKEYLNMCKDYAKEGNDYDKRYV